MMPLPTCPHCGEVCEYDPGERSVGIQPSHNCDDCQYTARAPERHEIEADREHDTE